MFHLKENMPVSNSTSVEAGSLPLIMWHAADDVSASCGVWPVSCSWTYWMPAGQSHLGLYFYPLGLTQQCRGFLVTHIQYNWSGKNQCPWKQPCLASLANIQIYSLATVKARPLYDNKSDEIMLSCTHCMLVCCLSAKLYNLLQRWEDCDQFKSVAGITFKPIVIVNWLHWFKRSTRSNFLTAQTGNVASPVWPTLFDSTWCLFGKHSQIHPCVNFVITCCHAEQ